MKNPVSSPVDIERYFSDFEMESVETTVDTPTLTVEVVTAQPSTGCDRSLKSAILPLWSSPDFANDRPTLSEEAIDRASQELIELRCQLDDEDDEDYGDWQIPSLAHDPMPPLQDWVGMGKASSRVAIAALLSLSLSGLAYGAWRVGVACTVASQCDLPALEAQTVRQWFSTVPALRPQTWAIAWRTWQAQASTAAPTPSPDPQAAEATYAAALETGFLAATLTQSAVTPNDWHGVVIEWERAIALLDAIPPDSADYAEAQTKRATYVAHKAYAEQEVDPFREAVNQAMEAAILTQTAQTAEDWQTVVDLWHNAISLMAQVPNQSEHYAVAQTKVVEYSRNVTYAEARATRP